MTKPHPLTLTPLSPTELASLAAETSAGLLGLACIGNAPVTRIRSLPLQHVAAPLLGTSPMAGQAVFAEVWRSASTCIAAEGQGICFRADANVLFGVLEVHEADFSAAGAGALQRATEDAYRRIFRLLDDEGFPQLWRVWNYFADINAGDPAATADGNLERYRQFNVGRQDAILASGRNTGGNVPAACALGVRSGPLSIAFIAGREAALPLENPRQVNAWNYPADYGPRPPTFARGVLANLPGQEWLFISGTASIVGHQTEHAGDVIAQANESMANIEAVLGEAGKASRAGIPAGNTHPAPYTLNDLEYRVYIRHADDYPAVRAALSAQLDAAVQVVYVQADICRSELLVEIEAMACRSMGSA